jgi:L-rhamnose mutarotase
MPLFLVQHPTCFREETLKRAQNDSIDEFGVTHFNMFYNEKENVLFCVMNAPDKDSLAKHYAKSGTKYDWIVEVKATK